ncbi:hypothetical protein DAEQUDRAFT_770507 [Daedalea quercina L-15889]|uniref:J domain-containing protein n=1 Tax=Daedalea quercina L-15889 TaxID=1314783 RepID=A0A165KTH8_9APHY|nr:hypothetical protein DAEQUDRAFT_770507 [Daedalea quercina L-15889]
MAIEQPNVLKGTWSNAEVAGSSDIHQGFVRNVRYGFVRNARGAATGLGSVRKLKRSLIFAVICVMRLGTIASSARTPRQCLPEWDGASSKPSAKSRHPKPASEAEQPKSDRAPDNGGSTTAAAGHDDDCKCMLCDLVKKRKRAEPKPSSAKATPRPADDGRTANHANGAHEATCKCFICLLKKRGRGKAEPEPNSEHARTGGDVPSPSGSSAGTPVGNTSSRGPACVCTVCNRTRTHDAKQAPVEHSQDHAAMQLWNRGTTALASGQIEQAIRLFGECIARDPNAAAFFTSRGDAHMATKDYSAASGDFQRACELLKGVPAPAKAASMLVKVARCRLCLGSHGSAMLAVQEALGIDASADAARALKRRLTRMQEEEAAYQRARAGGRWRAARTAWETCVRLYEEEGCVAPVDVRCWGVDLAVAECAWEKAKSAVDQLFAEAPQAIVVMLAKINLLFLSGELQHALEQAKAALKSDPDNLSFKSARTRIKDVLKAQGDARVCSCNHDAALESWHRALELVPDRPEDGGGGLLRARLLIDKAQAELELQRHAEALKSVDASLKLDAAHWRTYLIRGRIHAGLELFDAAVDDFKTCLQRALTKGSGASASDLESLRREVEETESLAAEAKNTVKDYYKILGLPRTCTLSEIRKAFRTESRKHHPDKGGIEEKFKLVNEAYSTLSDQDAKRAYDAQLDEQALGSTYEYDWGEDTYQNGGDFGWD